MSRNSASGRGPRKRAPSARIAGVREAILKAVAEDAPVTVRGIYYRVVSAGVVPKDQKGYNTVQSQVYRMRYEGAIDWDDISDGTRRLSKPRSWDSLEQFLGYYAKGENYRRGIWEDQGVEVIFLTEKDAIAGVVES